ncbi:transglutaminase-like domain-containing protein [Microbacterium rhizophilus]|uniref:transglutaminase-like domain-containing protein n=1 Tax=Microbacterium rhizophilus TaxID=3138934 RepID=UPI0031E7D124
MTPRDISVSLDIEVQSATELEMQIAVARVPGIRVDESLAVALDGEPVEYEELVDPVGGRIHRLKLRPGRLEVAYRAEVEHAGSPVPVAPHDRSVYLRPSRYAESDRFFALVGSQFDTARPIADLVDDVVAFVASRLRYVPGVSDVNDSAIDTLLDGAGVCRDYAHLTIAILRALGIPARLAAVYAPGLSPMDFHAVVEALVDDEWIVVDATRLAPRQSLVRIATGRDAADTAFLDSHGGSILLNSYGILATARGELPVDDGRARVRLA